MRVCLVLSGQSRFALENYRYFLEHFPQADIFIHTWAIDSNSSYAEWIDPNGLILSDPINISVVYKPIKMLVEAFSEYKTRNPNLQSNVAAMYYSIFKADQLRREFENVGGFEYDLVIRARFDLRILKRLPNIKPEPGAIYYADLIRDHEVPCDWLFLGDSKTMAKLSGLFLSLSPELIENCRNSGEKIMKHFSDVNLIPLKKFKFSGFLCRDLGLSNLNFGKVHFLDNFSLAFRFQISNLIRKFRTCFYTCYYLAFKLKSFVKEVI